MGDNFFDGLNHIYNTVLKRTHVGGAYATTLLIDKSVNASVFEVIKYYVLNPQAFDFRYIGINFQIRIKYLLILFLVISILWLFFSRRLKFKGTSGKINSLVITLWISILAPLSWFVIFKGHSYVHRMHDPIVWFMPFMFYGIGLFGVTTEKFLRGVWFSKSMNDSTNEYCP